MRAFVGAVRTRKEHMTVTVVTGGSAASAVMAIVRIEAPAGVEADVVEAELTRALHTHRKRPMTVELSLADGTGPWPRRGPARYAFVAVLTMAGHSEPERLAARIEKTARKAIRRRFGRPATAEVRTEISGAEAGAYWFSVRGTPHRQC
ncbi:MULTISPECIES: hypothetical protein [unclassified Pseudonocardia]|uniref:hypothetical protein n=2 Tax=unclassified Pseudonocardia TaxID=2619320 RepID=UPI0006CB3D30|nr:MULTISPECIES: hypothetical protein [unclassified Pseudonocardia]ALE84448.1 hypothetical protein XF36_15890 [Pseudonocardia sp. HH130629-09]